MIIRSGKGGFVGGFKTLIRGAFNFQYTKTSVSASVNVRLAITGKNKLIFAYEDNNLIFGYSDNTMTISD